MLHQPWQTIPIWNQPHWHNHELRILERTLMCVTISHKSKHAVPMYQLTVSDNRTISQRCEKLSIWVCLFFFSWQCSLCAFHVLSMCSLIKSLNSCVHSEVLPSNHWLRITKSIYQELALCDWLQNITHQALTSEMSKRCFGVTILPPIVSRSAIPSREVHTGVTPECLPSMTGIARLCGTNSMPWTVRHLHLHYL